MSQLEKLEQLAISLHCDVRNQEPMRKHTTFKIGGPADLFIVVNDVQALQSVYTAAKELGVPCMVIGKGSNLLVKDSGIRGAVIQLGGAFFDINLKENNVQGHLRSNSIIMCQMIFTSDQVLFDKSQKMKYPLPLTIMIRDIYTTT